MVIAMEIGILNGQSPGFFSTEPFEKRPVMTMQTYVCTQAPCVSAKEPNVSTKQPFVSAKEPHVSTKQPFVSAKEPHVSTKQPFVSAKEPLRAIRKETCHDHSEF